MLFWAETREIRKPAQLLTELVIASLLLGEVLTSVDSLKKTPGRMITASICLQKDLTVVGLLEKGKEQIAIARSSGLDQYVVPKAVQLFAGDDSEIDEQAMTPHVSELVEAGANFQPLNK